MKTPTLLSLVLLCSCAAGGAQPAPEAAPGRAPGGEYAATYTAFAAACFEDAPWVSAFKEKSGRAPLVRVVPVADETGKNRSTPKLHDAIEKLLLGRADIDLAAPAAAVGELQSLRMLTGVNDDDEGDEGISMGDFFISTVFRPKPNQPPESDEYDLFVQLVDIEAGEVVCGLGIVEQP